MRDSTVIVGYPELVAFFMRKFSNVFKSDWLVESHEMTGLLLNQFKIYKIYIVIPLLLAKSLITLPLQNDWAASKSI